MVCAVGAVKCATLYAGGIEGAGGVEVTCCVLLCMLEVLDMLKDVRCVLGTVKVV